MPYFPNKVGASITPDFCALPLCSLSPHATCHYSRGHSLPPRQGTSSRFLEGVATATSSLSLALAGQRCRAWCFTAYDFTDYVALGELNRDVTYLVAGKETCPDTGRLHQQGYVEFRNPLSLAAVKVHLDAPALHLAARRGTSQEAAEYCKKDGDWREWGQLSRQGARNDLAAIREVVAATGSIKAVCEAATSYQGLRAGELLLKYVSTGDRAPPRVKWYWGPTGTGKTRAAIAEAGAEPYWLSSGTLQWWDGYDGERYVILDDFRPEPAVSFARVLRYLDRYAVRVPVKGGTRELRATVMVVTSNLDPALAYDGRLLPGESVAPLLRRLHVVRHFPVGPLHAWVAGH